MKSAATSYQRILFLSLVCSWLLLLPTASSFSLPSFMRRYNSNNNRVNAATTRRTTSRLQATVTNQSDFLLGAATSKPATVVVVKKEEEEEPTVMRTKTAKQFKSKPSSIVEETATDRQHHKDGEENWLDKMVQATKSSYLQNQNESLQHNADSDKKKQNKLLHPLVQQGVWTAYFDESEASIGLVYYFNQETGESQWSRPTENFPVVTLSDRLQTIAEQRQQAYLEKRKNKEENSSSGDVVDDDGDGDGDGVAKSKNVPASSSSRRKALLAEKVVAALKNSKRQDSVKERTVMTPLATEGEWEAHVDTQTSGFVYFWNKVTGQSQWTPPTTTFPIVEGHPLRPIPKPVSRISISTTPHPRPLATEGDWTAYFDGDKSFMIYYFNQKTGVSQWEKPMLNFPLIRLTERMQQRMLEEQGQQKQQLVQVDVPTPQDRQRRPLAKQGDWEAYFDDLTTMKIYYVNSATGASQWNKPTANFPTIRLPGRIKKLTQGQQVIENEKDEQDGFLTWLVDTVFHVAEERAAVTAQRNTVKKLKGSPFALAENFFDMFGSFKRDRETEKKKLSMSKENSTFLRVGGDHDDDNKTIPFFVSKRSGY